MTVTLSCLIHNKPNLILVPATTPLNDALAVMHQHNITSVVVERDGNFLGFVSTIEIMTELAFGSFEWEKPNPEEFELIKSSEKTVESVLNINKKTQQIHYFKANDLLINVFEPMSKGVRRVLVSTNFGTYRIVSQTDVVSYVATHLQLLNLPIDLKQSIVDAKLVTDPPKQEIWKIDGTETALNGFRFLVLRNILSAPVVDENGAILTSLSASDLRGVRSENLKAVLLPTTEYLTNVYGALIPPITCSINDSLQLVVLKLAAARVKRIWIVNGDNKPIGAVSLRSVIGLFHSSVKI